MPMSGYDVGDLKFARRTEILQSSFVFMINEGQQLTIAAT